MLAGGLATGGVGLVVDGLAVVARELPPRD